MVQRSVTRRHHNARTGLALICCIALVAGCSSSDNSKSQEPDELAAPVGPIRLANCTDWRNGTVDQRRATVAQLRKFAGGPVGSSSGIQRGPVLDDSQAYRLLDNYCSAYFARGFKLYKLYVRAAGFAGR